MTLKIIDKTQFREMPWANGGGITTELFARKDERSGHILWRLSLAGVAADGPFSHFANYNRILVLMMGHGLKLSHGDGTEHILANVYDQATFPGDADTHATLTSGPVLDFNVITDRDRFRSVVTVMQNAKKKRVAAIASVLAIYAVDNELLITDPDKGRHVLQKGDLLLVDAPEQSDWIVTGGTAIATQLLQLHKH